MLYEVITDITISSSLYDGATLDIDLDQIATLFDVSEEDLLLGIAQEDGAPEIT